MIKALEVQKTDENLIRAIIIEQNEDGFKNVFDIAEGTFEEVAHWFFDNGSDVYAVFVDGEFQSPDALSTWEAACAVLGI